MNIRVHTNFQSLGLTVPVATAKPEKIRIRVYDEANPLTVFTDRYNTVNGKVDFYVRMPLTSKNVVVSIFNEKNGNKPKGADRSFNVGNITPSGLERKFSVADLEAPIARFVEFAQRFSFNASYLKDNQIYSSDDGNYEIQYLPVVTDSRGNPKKTPCSVSAQTGLIRVGKKAFEKMTVPMRMALLLHEYSHFYLNNNPANETEADVNALTIYLGLGYPRIEAYEAFLSVFENTPTNQNVNRYNVINDFISNFEKQKFYIK
jgi:hypothetical protein